MEPDDPLFEALWSRVLEAWDDDKAHQALLQHAMRAEQLPELAGRYRELLNDPAREERARKKLDGVVFAATQLLLATKTPKPEGAPWALTVIAALVSFGLLFWMAKLVLSR